MNQMQQYLNELKVDLLKADGGIDDLSKERYIVKEVGDWISYGKGETQESVVELKELDGHLNTVYIRITESRTGSYSFYYNYEETEFEFVEPFDVITTEWRVKK